MTLFRQKRSKVELPQTPLNYPSGVAVSTGTAVYFIKNKTKFKVFSERVLQSWRFDILQGTTESLSHHTYGGNLGFRDGTLINNIADGKMYLVSGNKRRHIQSPDVFNRYGFDESRMIRVSNEETNLHQEGEPLV